MKNRVKIKFQKLRNLISILLIFAIVTTIGNYAYDVYKGNAIYNNYSAINKANKALRDSEHLISKQHHAEVMHCNFLLTKNVYYIDNYQTVSVSIDNVLDQLDEYAVGNKLHENLLSEIRSNIKTRFSRMNNINMMVSKSYFDEHFELEFDYKDKDKTEIINKQILQLQKLIEDEIVIENKRINDKIHTFLIIRLPLVLFILIILIAAILVIRQVKNVRKELYMNLMEQNRKYLLDRGEKADSLVQENDVVQVIIENLKNAIEFIRQISAGNYNYNFVGLSKGKLNQNKNNLAGELQNMRDILQKAVEEDKKRKQEDEKRNWTTIGIAQFGDLLQQNSNNLHKLADIILKNLVEYLSANQGGIFLIDEVNDDTLTLTASYAYNRKKFLNKTIKLGEGLVGACAMERQRFFMTNLPEGYIEISSMLGETSPRNLLIEPLILDDKILGVIEIASFNEFKGHHLDFIEKVCHSISSTILSVRINSKTSLLLEQSQQQAEMLSSQEEELRQNLEELQATQEDAAKKGDELEALFDVINETLGAIEFDENGVIKKSNYYISNKFKLKHYDIIEQTHSTLLTLMGVDISNYEKEWQRLRHGFTINTNRTYRLKNGTRVWTKETYKPIQNDMGIVNKVLAVIIDETEYVNTEKKLNDMLKDEQTKLKKLKNEQKINNDKILELFDKINKLEQYSGTKTKELEQLKDRFLKLKEHEIELNQLCNDMKVSETELKKEVQRLNGLKNEMFEKNSSMVKKTIEINKKNEEMFTTLEKHKIDKEVLLVDNETLSSDKTLLLGMLDQLQLAVFWKDRSSVYLGCNTQFAQLAGCDDIKEIINTTDEQHPWRDIAEQLENEDTQVIKSGKPKAIKKTITLANGKKNNVIMRRYPVFDNTNEITGLWGILEFK